MTISRMIVCEAVSDELANEVIAKMHEHIRDISGLITHSILIEEGGRMVILITEWPSREQCLAYHMSRAYRQLVAATQHMLLGNYVVKLFQNKTAMRFGADVEQPRPDSLVAQRD